MFLYIYQLFTLTHNCIDCINNRWYLYIFVISTDTKGLIATDMVTMKFVVLHNRNKDIK